MTEAAPTTMNRTVRRLANSAYRPREYLTEGEVEKLIDTARKRGRNGPRDASDPVSLSAWAARSGTLSAPLVADRSQARQIACEQGEGRPRERSSQRGQVPGIISQTGEQCESVHCRQSHIEAS
jgi:hypothetical protein